mgnify:CR=1 FL=1
MSSCEGGASEGPARPSRASRWAAPARRAERAWALDGAQVRYEVVGFLAKNKDSLFAELPEVMRHADSKLARLLFADDGRAGTVPAGASGARASSPRRQRSRSRLRLLLASLTRRS